MQPNGFNVGHGVISISADIDKDQIARTVSDAGKRAGQGLIKSISENLKRDKSASIAAGSAGEDAGESFGRRFSSQVKRSASGAGKSLSSTLGKMAGPGIMAALAPAMATAGPLLGSALAVGIGGALIAGLGVVGIGAGIALVANSPQVKSAFDGLKKQVTTGLKEAAKPFIGPVVQSIGIFKKTFDQILPSITRMFQFLAPYVTKFAQGISDAVLKVMPAIENVIMNSGPLLSGMASSIGKLGSGLAAFLNGTVGMFNKMKALWSGNGGAGPFSNLPLIIEKVKAMGGTFMEIFNDIKKVIMDNKTQFQTLINFIMGISNILWSAVGPIFKALGEAIKAVIGILGGLIDFFAGVFTGDWKRAGDGLHKIWFSLWEGIKGILNNAFQALINIAKNIWAGIKNSVIGFKNWFVNGWKTMWTDAKNTIVNMGNSIRDGITTRFNTMKTNIKNAINGVKDFITGMRDHIGNMVRSIGDKFTSFKDNTIKAFSLAKDGVKKVWDKLQEVAKKPVNFVIDPVYANIRNLWNNIAGKVGLGQLPVINKFAKGGVAPGSGRGDTVPAMLTPGEGILTVDEMNKLGGPKGFAQLRNQIQYFANGGIVGWVKDKLGGAVRGGLYKGAKAVADRWVYPFINQMQGGNGFDGLMKAGANKLIGSALNWIKGDDKKHAAPAGSSGMGYQNMMKLLRSKFPGLPLISGYRPGSVTLSGNRSYHASGRAVDLPPRRDVAQWIHDNYKGITKELITPYQQYNLHNGRSHRYTGAIWNQHNFAGGNAHDHWAVDNGGVLKPKSSAILTNATSDNEYMLTREHLKDVVGDKHYHVTYQVKMDEVDDVHKLMRTIQDLDKAIMAGVQFTG